MPTAPAPAAPALEPRALPAGRGADWLAEGYALFRRQPGVWIGIVLIWIVISAILAAVPGLNLVGSFLSPIFTAGIMLGCAALARGEELRIEHLFAAFRSGRVGPLLMLTVWMVLLGLAGVVLLVLALAVPVGGALQGLDSPEDLLRAVGLGGVLAFVLGVLAIALLLTMAVWFAPALIVFHPVTALEAIKLSFGGCLRNWLPLTVYGLLLLVMLIAAVIPLLLGLLIALPVLMASIYASYRDIYPGAPG